MSASVTQSDRKPSHRTVSPAPGVRSKPEREKIRAPLLSWEDLIK